ncbi:futalosine hydrolase [Geotalea uraniireducens]|uniref:Futalosine hydrolase n=1 Tax=Geotalea uraniireducens (strain Rf4) TaxID=351605 RepID=A5GC07_GEOUR|nr:futalosine hydrolase [Geotalea uraniireducens]ABQ24897.1 purine or other phosphorylase, family 1 [Geotalea uraniireducens Rf4]
MKPVFVTASTIQELSMLVRVIGARQRADAGLREVYDGRIGKRDIIIAVTGMGKVNAASAITALLEHVSPQILINTGCCGAYRGSSLTPGDLAVATAEIFADEGVLTSTGWRPLDFIGIPFVVRNGKSFFNEFPLSVQAAEKAVHLAAALGLSIKRGKFLTVSTCSGTTGRGDELYRRFGGICENMEGAAAAQIALRYGVDCLEIRGISNMVEDRDLSRWDIPRAVEAAQRFLLKYIEEL